MTIELFSSPLWRLVGWLPGTAFRMIFTEKRLASLIRLSPRATGDQVVFNRGDTPEVRIYLDVDNRSPFSVELDRLVVELWHQKYIGELFYIDRVEIPPGSVESIIIHGLKGARYSDIKPSHGPSSTSLMSIRGYFNSKVRSFKVNTGNIESIHVNVVN